MNGKFYQFCITRTNGVGWERCNVSPDLAYGVNLDAMEERSDEVLLHPDFKDPSGILDKIYVRSGFLIHSQAKYAGKDEGNREICFSHGYLWEDAYAVLREPERFLALSDGNYRFSEEETRQIPEALSYDAPLSPPDVLCGELGIDPSVLPTVARCILFMLMSKASVKLFVVSRGDRKAALSLLCLFYQLLPYPFRPKISASTYGTGENALGNLIFTDRIPEDQKWFDPYTGENNVLNERFEQALREDPYLLWQAERIARQQYDPALFPEAERCVSEFANPREIDFGAMKLAFRTYAASLPDTALTGEEQRWLIGQWIGKLQEGKRDAAAHLLFLAERDDALPDDPQRMREVLQTVLRSDASEEDKERAEAARKRLDAALVVRGGQEEAMRLISSYYEKRNGFASFAEEVIFRGGQERLDDFAVREAERIPFVSGNREANCNLIRNMMNGCSACVSEKGQERVCRALTEGVLQFVLASLPSHSFEKAADAYRYYCGIINGASDESVPEPLIDANHRKFLGLAENAVQVSTYAFDSFRAFYETYAERFPDEAEFYRMRALACDPDAPHGTLQKLDEYLDRPASHNAEQELINREISGCLLKNGRLMRKCTDLRFWTLLTCYAKNGGSVGAAVSEMLRVGCVLLTERSVLVQALEEKTFCQSFRETDSVYRVLLQGDNGIGGGRYPMPAEQLETVRQHREKLLLSAPDYELTEENKQERDELLRQKEKEKRERQKEAERKKKEEERLLREQQKLEEDARKKQLKEQKKQQKALEKAQKDAPDEEAEEEPEEESETDADADAGGQEEGTVEKEPVIPAEKEDETDDTAAEEPLPDAPAGAVDPLPAIRRRLSGSGVKKRKKEREDKKMPAEAEEGLPSAPVRVRHGKRKKRSEQNTDHVLNYSVIILLALILVGIIVLVWIIVSDSRSPDPAVIPAVVQETEGSEVQAAAFTDGQWEPPV